MKIYAISDIHGYYDEMIESLKKVDLSDDNKLIFLGDYVDYGPDSGKVVQYIHDLQIKHGKDKVIVLKGNHEDMLLNWYKRGAGDWFLADSDAGLRTFYSFISKEAKEEFDLFALSASAKDISNKGREILKREKNELLSWINSLSLYYKTEKQIFVHAGVDEEAEDLWEYGTPDYEFMWKYPPTKGEFLLTVIAGHIGTHSEYLSGENDYHGIYYDGASHYYIDGTVNVSGKIPVLSYDSVKDGYQVL